MERETKMNINDKNKMVLEYRGNISKKGALNISQGRSEHGRVCTLSNEDIKGKQIDIRKCTTTQSYYAVLVFGNSQTIWSKTTHLDDIEKFSADELQKIKVELVVDICIQKNIISRLESFDFQKRIRETKEYIEHLEALKEKVDLAFENRTVKNNEELINAASAKEIQKSEFEIWENEGFFCRPNFKFAFPEHFNNQLFLEYMEMIDEEAGHGFHKERNETFPICTQFYKDITRGTYFIIDENGKKDELSSKNYEHDLGCSWMKYRILKFLNFCDNDPEKLFKLSQCMHQGMGNAYVKIIADASDSPQKVKHFFTTSINDVKKHDRYYELIKDKCGNITLKYIDIFNDLNYILYDGDFIGTDGTKSYYHLETGIILDKDNIWRQYNEGGVEYQIVKKQTTSIPTSKR